MGHSKPLVSVLMSAYNNEDYIDTAISSVLSETYTHIELLIYDDGSTDNTLEKINEWQKKDPRITVIEGKVNSGSFAKNLITLSGHIHGDFFIISDSDDYFFPYRIERLMALMDDATHVTYGKSIHTDHALKNWGHECFKPFSHVELIKHNYICNGAHLIRTSTFKSLGGYNLVKFAEDWELLLRLSTLGPFKFIDDTMLLYRQHSTNYTKKQADIIVLEESRFLSNFVRQYIIHDISNWQHLPDVKKQITFDLFFGYFLRFASMTQAIQPFETPDFPVGTANKTTLSKKAPDTTWVDLLQQPNVHLMNLATIDIHFFNYEMFNLIMAHLFPNIPLEKQQQNYLFLLQYLIGAPNDLRASGSTLCLPFHQFYEAITR